MSTPTRELKRSHVQLINCVHYHVHYVHYQNNVFLPHHVHPVQHVHHHHNVHNRINEIHVTSKVNAEKVPEEWREMGKEAPKRQSTPQREVGHQLLTITENDKCDSDAPLYIGHTTHSTL